MKIPPARALALALVVLVLALGAACSGSGSDSDSNSASDSAGGLSDEAEQGGAAESDSDALSAQRGSAPAAKAGRPAPLVDDRAVIRRGTVELSARDVGDAQFEVQRLVDRYGGQVAKEETTTNDDGEPAYTRMVLRIPSEDFADAMTELRGVAEFRAANTDEDDVTAKVIDTQTRLTVQRRSIDRITALLARAQSIRDIMAIESQLSIRQADLESLERQARFLAGQTSMSTITVSIDEIPDKQGSAKGEDETGFLAGLSAGWDGLSAFAVGLATVAGALLPWLVVAAVLGLPALLLARAARRRRTQPEPGPAPEG